MSKIKKLAGETVLYGLGSIVPRFLNFLLVSLHTRVLPAGEYGIITDILAFVAFLNVIYAFGMETAYFRFATKSENDEKHIFNLAQTTVIAVSVVTSLVLIIFARPIANDMGFAGNVDYLYWTIGIMFIDALVIVPFARLRLQKKGLTFALGKVINVLIVIALNIYFLKVIYDPEVGFAYVLLATLIGNAFFLLFFSRTLLSWRPTYDRRITREMFRYAYPVMLTGLPAMINEMFSRKTLRYWLPEGYYPGKTENEILGIFGATYKFAVVMNLAILAFRYAAEPFFFSNAADKNSPELFARVNHYFTLLCCVILLGVSINLDILKLFLGNSQYYDGLRIVPVLLLGYLFLGIYYNLSVWFKLTDKTYYGTYITLGGAIITIVGNYFLVPIAGIDGSSWATFICYFTMTVVCYLLGRKYYPIPYKVVQGISYITLTLALVYAINSIVIENIWLASSFHMLVFVAYLLIIYFLERKDLKASRR
ncbi:lipopolysaccharide biosynthesis protein [Pseudochryseolinea flava]|uniref:Polysaccharide biosynthesis protein n=1 Tax=Pseudochryseolinea flava TaxID=2059302 RepID=A0A364XZ17_9BACT|nr:polysaccharide biosynthesis C-terminal domain-containing protein [Pseudochryseolinea flava]RAV99771.1 polysaccharide biosynthesis protein [Pseudochryseolinea flava]